jgi:hypothetical protein
VDAHVHVLSIFTSFSWKQRLYPIILPISAAIREYPTSGTHALMSDGAGQYKQMGVLISPQLGTAAK